MKVVAFSTLPVRVLSWDTEMGLRYRVQVQAEGEWRSASGILDWKGAEPVLRALGVRA